jgi:Carboxypeptidase regulatory-like domain/TonB dependent receptor/TonB-dependent Receptor Plug Domain
MTRSIYRHPIRPYLMIMGVIFCTLAIRSLPDNSVGLRLRSTFAQTATSTLSGTVHDEKGAVVPNVSIAVTNEATQIKREVTTNKDGLFTFPLLKPGKYTVDARHDGFIPAKYTNIALEVGDQVSLRVEMKVGAIGETVTIEGASLIREDGAVGTVINQKLIENLPLNGRSFQSLIALTPGVVFTKSNFNESGQFSVNGQRANSNYFMVDGVSANAGVNAAIAPGQSLGGALPSLATTGGTNNLVSLEALQEFQVQTSSFAPEYGRTPGAQVSIVTRSGTNEFHFKLFEYFRNDALDANDWFANREGNSKPALRQNNFGGVLGGPIIKNHTFFFFSFEGLRLRQPQTIVVPVPSVASRLEAQPQIRPFLNAYPVPNGPELGNGFAGFSSSYSDPSTLSATSFRLDHIFNQKFTLFSRYNYAPSETITRGVENSANNINETKFNTQTLTVGSTMSLTPKTSNDLRFNYSRSRASAFLTLDNFGQANPPNDSDMFPAFASSKDSLFNFILIGGQFLSIGKNVDNVQRQINLVENLSVITGNHQLKFGADYRRLSPTIGPRNYEQTPIFLGLTGPLGAISGIPLQTQVGAQETVTLLYHNFSTYGQDTWKLTPRLNLTYGVRWDFNPPPVGQDGKDLYTVLGLDNPVMLALAPQGTPLFETTYGNFAPRIGLAYQVSQTKGRETVLRGGFGIFYDAGQGVIGNNAITFPYRRTKVVSGESFPLTPEQSTPPAFSLTPESSTINVADPNLKLPRIYQWNVSLEQWLGVNQTISASYIGASGRRLLRQEQLVTPNTKFERVSLTKNTATSDYHALQLQYNRRLSRGVQAMAAYTWSHSIDIASNDSGVFTSDTFVNPTIDRGSSDFDVRHAFTGAITYNISTPNLGSVPNAMLRNWSLDTIFSARSATPVDMIGGQSSIGFSAPLRPDLIPGIPLYIEDTNAPGGRRLNDTVDPHRPGCKGPFCPPAGLQGTLGRNVLRGVPVNQIDLALRRQFNMTEQLNIQLRVEFFNLFNHPNFGDPEGDLAKLQFGRSIRMLGRTLGSGGANGGFNPLYQLGGPRSLQIALKIQF